MLISVISLVIIDVILKSWLINIYSETKEIVIINGFLKLSAVNNFQMVFAFPGTSTIRIQPASIIQVVFSILVLIRIFNRKISNIFYLGAYMIVIGWIGSKIDIWFLNPNNGNNIVYHGLDYIHFEVLSLPVFDVSKTMINLGWVVIVFGAVLRFKDFKTLLKKQNKNSAQQAE